MKTRRVIFALFFALGLVVFVLGNKNVFTASLTQDAIAPEVGPPSPSIESSADQGTGRPTSDDADEDKPAFSKATADKQDQIDDILEKIDILERQIADLKALENVAEQELAIADDQEEPVTIPPKADLVGEEPKPESQQDIIIAPRVQRGGGGSRPIYPKILISEVQIESTADEKQEFVELYNPQESEIDLTNWYLQRKTKTADSFSSFAPHTLFSGKKISAKGYFLIARQDSGFAADILVDNPLTQDNTLILKNPNGEISDKVGWGQAQDYELLPTANPGAGQSIGRKITSNEPQDTDVNEADFEINQPTPRSANIKYVPPAPVAEPAPTDTLSPEVIFTLDAIQKSLGFTVNFTIIDPLGTVSPSGIESYIFRWQKESDGWQEDSLEVVSPSLAQIFVAREFTGQDETTYSFQVKAQDVAGNESAWLPETPAQTKISLLKEEGPPPSDPPPGANIVINEIAWMGGVNSTADEWIELLNVGETLVDLSGWTLDWADATTTVSMSLSGIINAHGFYLLERTNDDSVPNVPADQIYTGALGNGGEHLYLRDALGNTKDEINCTEKWFAGDNKTKQTMQRKDAATLGNDQSNWQTSEGVGGSPRF